MTASAAGKLIVAGEHAVVYGCPALVVGIDRGLEATVERSSEAETHVTLLGTRHRLSDDGDLSKALGALLDHLGCTEPLDIVVRGALVPGVGMGFSACAAVCIARAVLALFGGRDEGAVREAAMKWEGVFHGNPSGADVAASMSEGCIRFSKSDGVGRVSVGRALQFCVGLTGVTSATHEMVASVAELRQRQPKMVEQSFAAMATVVDNTIGAIEDGRIEDAGHLMDYNQMLLSGIMVSTMEIEQLCQTARSQGAYGAKLSGAGGGGIVVALTGEAQTADADERAARVLHAWSNIGYDGFKVRMKGVDT